MRTANEIERIRAVYIERDRQIALCDEWLRPGQQFWYSRTYVECLRLLNHTGCLPLEDKRILDIGCGRGQWLITFLHYGASQQNLAGIDLIPDRVDIARRRLAAAELRCGDASQLPWPDQSFDIVSQFVMFTSILSSELKAAVAREMLRVLRPGGAILWYDFRWNNPANPHVRGIGRREIESLFPCCIPTIATVTLLPLLARRVSQISFAAGYLLSAIPWLRTHHLAILRKPGTP